MKIRNHSPKIEKARGSPDVFSYYPLKAGVMLAFWGTLILLCWIYRDRITVEGIVNFVPGNTTVAICIMLVLFALKGVTIIVYGGILYAASGILFSLPVAICVNLAGTALMTSVPFFIGKKAGAKMLDQLARKNKRLDLTLIGYSVIIHYCGRNKPWKENYVGQLDVFYKEAEKRLLQEA